MPTLFQKGDVLHTEGLSVFFLTVPANGTLGAGAAIAFAKHFPGLAEAYAAHAAATKLQLGDVFTWQGEGATVYLLVTVTANPKLAPLGRALGSALAAAVAAGHSRVGTPRLGAGLDKLRVRRLIEDETKDVPITLEVFEQFVRQPDTKPTND